MSGTSNGDVSEPMDCDCQDEALLTLSLKWPPSDEPNKPKTTLEKLLQTWFNQRKKGTDCSVENIQKDGTALIKVSPSPALSELQELKGQTVSSKDGKVTIQSISLGSPNQASQGSDNELTNVSSSVQEPQAAQEQDKNQSDPVGKDNDPQRKYSLEAHKTASDDCLVPVSVYWYVNHIYKEEIKRIMKENGVEMEANVNVKFTAKQKDGNPEGALFEFTQLVQNSLSDSQGSVIPLKFVDTDQWSDAMRVIQDKETKILITLSSEEATVCGPAQSQNDICCALNATQKRNPSLDEHRSAPQDTSQKITMTINDPLVDDGLTLEESHWKLMNATRAEELSQIKKKFSVKLRDSSPSQGKISVRASYVGPEGNASLESHAVRALLHLYQKTATLLPTSAQTYGATGFSDSGEKFRNDHRLEGPSSGPAFNGESTKHHKKAQTKDGATAGDNEEDKCPICLSQFVNKKQLKCKHEFCNDCLQQAEKHRGPICPLCQDVFGVMEGDQPNGTMTWAKNSMPLPGFPDCGHIFIIYDIPSGVQTTKHPNPGQHFYGTGRVAYLPDNKEGNEVLCLLKKAFDQKLVFTVGASRTTGAENQVTWNDVHHKTSMTGGPQNFGYPDPNYLKRVKEELKAKGIK